MADFKERLRADARWVYNLLFILGCLPSDAGEFPVVHMYVALVIIFFGFTMCANAVYKAWFDDIEDFVYYITPVLGSTLSVVKMCNFMAYRKQFFFLMKTVKDKFWFNVSISPAEREIILQFSRTLYLSTTAQVTGLALAVPLWLLKPMVEMLLQALHSEPVIKKLPIPGWIPVPTDASYVTVYVVTAISTFFIASCVAGMDCLYFYFVLHTCGQFKIIQTRVKNFDKTETGLICSIEKQEKIIWNIIEHHKDLMEFSKKVEHVMTVHIVMQFVVATLFLCCAAIIATLFPGNVFIYLQCGLLITTSTIETFLHCLPGTMLTTESFGVALAAYDSDWYNAPIHIQKQLMFILARAQHPVILTVGKLIPVSLESFESIIRTSASYFTILQSMQEDS